MRPGVRLRLSFTLAGTALMLAAGSAQVPSAPTGVTITLTPTGSDTTPPVISAVAVSAVTASTATVTWTTNESSDSRIDYGPIIYNNATPVNSSLVTSHSIALTGLAQGTLYHVRARSRDAAGNLGISGDTTLTTAGGLQLTLAPQDTTINVNTTNYSSDALLRTYTWADNQVANAILMKFDLSTVPLGAVVSNATLQLALVQSDTTADAIYAVTAHKLLTKNPVIASATGYTSDGSTPWTPNACCSGAAPMAQADISAPYSTASIDKTNGYKSWTITQMVQEWLLAPVTNFGVLLNSDTSKLSDRFRYFGSMENSDSTLRPLLRITYTVPLDILPPVISAVAASAITPSAATISWTTNEAADSQVEYGTTVAYGNSTTLNTSFVLSHALPLSGLTPNTQYHFRVRSKDPAANLSVSGDSVFTTLSADTTPPVISSVAAGSLTASAATITWTTNEASDSQVDYGTTTAYGSQTTINSSLVTGHSVALGSLSANTTYHFRVRSRDAALNLGLSGDATFTTTSVPPSGWTHEPSGLTVWTNQSMDTLTGSGWGINNASAYASVVADPAAPVSPSGVGQWRYPTGFPGGESPATMYRTLPPSFNEGFVGVSWKPSNPWQGHSSNVNKIFFLLGGGCGNLIPIMYGPPGGPYQLRVAPEWGSWSWLTPNVNDVPVALGAWHKIELYFKYNTPGHGIVRWWMDGTLIGDYTSISFPASGCFAEFQFAPTWGGVGDVKNETDFFWFDHAYVSYPSGGASGDTSPPSVSISTPPSGANVSGAAATITATASDDMGVTGVQFKLDGANLGAEDTTAPYSISWNTTTVTDGVHTLTSVARDAAGNQTISGGVTVTVANDIGGTVLFQEGFDDANLASRGWYDNTSALLSTTEHPAGSVSSIQYKFNAGATSPTAGAALRKKFTPTNSVYLSYYVKYSTNWVGSQQPYHPHEFHFLTTLEGDWSGLSFDHLTAYVEQNAGTPLIAIQDGTNVDQTRVGVNLTAVTENRGVAGCNGSSDGYPDNCYSNGTAFVNEKKWRAAAQYFTDSAGPFYKNDWHFVEAYLKLNTIAAGKGVNDGVIQYWFDGQLLIDRHDVLLRTGANPTMLFNQLVIAPYIGDGSPVTQSMWVSQITVATGRR